MVRHIVLLRWRDSVTELDKSTACQALSRLPEAIPDIIDYWYGGDLGLTQGNFDFAIVGDFRDREAFLRYAEDPVHLATVARYLRPIIDDRVAVQHEWG